jgi:hypothetical protein
MVRCTEYIQRMGLYDDNGVAIGGCTLLRT